MKLIVPVWKRYAAVTTLSRNKTHKRTGDTCKSYIVASACPIVFLGVKTLYFFLPNVTRVRGYPHRRAAGSPLQYIVGAGGGKKNQNKKNGFISHQINLSHRARSRWSWARGRTCSDTCPSLFSPPLFETFRIFFDIANPAARETKKNKTSRIHSPRYTYCYYRLCTIFPQVPVAFLTFRRYIV